MGIGPHEKGVHVDKRFGSQLHEGDFLKICSQERNDCERKFKQIRGRWNYRSIEKGRKCREIDRYKEKEKYCCIILINGDKVSEKGPLQEN